MEFRRYSNSARFPYNSINRTVEIDLEIFDGTVEFLVFAGINDYHSWLYCYREDVALYHWRNITGLEFKFTLDNQTVYITRRSHQGGATEVGSIIATCILI